MMGRLRRAGERVGVLGDLHLGRHLYGYDLTPHIRSVLYAFAKLCARQGVRTIVVLGDVFDAPRPSLELERLLVQWVNECTRRGMTVFVLCGNHDVLASSRAYSSLATLRAMGHPTVHVIHQPWLHAMPSGALLGLVPFPPPAMYSHTFEWDEEVEHMLHKAAKLGGTLYAFTHLNVAGAVMGAQEWVYRGADYLLPERIPQRAKLAFNGHIHKRQWMLSRKVLLLGAASRLSFDDADNTSACAVLDTSSGKVKLHDLPELLMVRLTYDASSAAQHKKLAPTTQEVVSWAEEQQVAGALVQLQPIVDEQTSVEWQAVRDALYKVGAEFVCVAAPKRLRAERAAEAVARTTTAATDPVVAAQPFLKRLVRDKAERQHLSAYLKRAVAEADQR